MNESAENHPAAPEKNGVSLNPLLLVWKAVTSIRTAVIILAFSLVLVFMGTWAQKDEGLYAAQERWFKHWFIIRGDEMAAPHGDPWWVPPIFPGGYLLGTLFLINMLSAHFRRFTRPPGGLAVMLLHYIGVLGLLYLVTATLIWYPLMFTGALLLVAVADWVAAAVFKLGSSRKLGVDFAHIGIALLLVGQLATDMMAVESKMAFKVGMARSFTEHHMDHELFAETDVDEEKGTPVTRERVVSFPQDWITSDAQLNHTDMPFTLRVKEFHRNGVIIKRSDAMEMEATLRQALATVESRYASPDNLTTLATEAAANPEHVSAWREALRNLGRDAVPGPEKTAAALAGDRPAAETFLNELKKVFRKRMEDRFESFTAESRFAVARIRANQPITETSPPVQADHGAAPRGFLVESLPESRTMDGVNLSWAVVEVIHKGNSLGTWLLHPGLTAQEIRLDDRSWRIGIRLERFDLPFSVTLKSATQLNYAGTEIPRDYRSKVLVNYPARNETREVDIYMNQPLRYKFTSADGKNEQLTFFQQQMGRSSPGSTIGFSQLQVVNNPGWFTPYFGCIVVGYGLGRHFLMHLSAFGRRRRAAAANANATASAS